ncbi:MAG TPA: adenylosuccinate synthetase [Longimicrobium sp.]|nr:adenylosuccinate synthetase [Longimicrobium sp.]
MKQARVVIGASFGDEGKGLMTDYFARAQGGRGTLVARFNGGAQAGHTVVVDAGTRHVFSHFGAGTLAGAGTLLTRHFIANPMVFGREHGALVRLGVSPRVRIDPRALITTPYDMLINEMVETTRGAGRHGSVGLGINETVTRSEAPDFHLSVGMARRDPGAVRAALGRILNEWVPRRVATLGIGAEYERRKAIVTSGTLVENWLLVLDEFLRDVQVRADLDVLREHERVVFEGAQGLALDQSRGTFPHVTRSNTGVRNVVELMNELPPARLAVTYATRAYVTRHGAGPLEGELEGKPFPGVYDLTNVPHDFQGPLRYALLDVDALGRRIRDDFADAALLERSFGARIGVAVTCLDQLPATAAWTRAGDGVQGSRQDLVDAVAATLPAASAGAPAEVFVAYGPRASDVAPGAPVRSPAGGFVTRPWRHSEVGAGSIHPVT